MIAEFNCIHAIVPKRKYTSTVMTIHADIENEELVLACLKQVGIPEMVKILVQENSLYQSHLENALKGYENGLEKEAKV